MHRILKFWEMSGGSAEDGIQRLSHMPVEVLIQPGGQRLSQFPVEVLIRVSKFQQLNQFDQFDLLKLQTPYMQEDLTTQALCAVLGSLLQQMADEINKIIILARVDYLTEEILDQLAYELHIEWYDSTASLAVKRALIKSSDRVHMYLGTPYAVSQVVNDYLNHGTLQEWFEYGGDPYHFRVLTTAADIADPALVAQLTRAVNYSKNARSYFDGFAVSGTHAALASYTHLQLQAYTHAQLASGI